MALKNTVAAERRLDLASLFCMIGRHGPAVALAVIAMVSVLAAFIIYRTVRGKRRKAAAGDGEMSSAGEERDASVIHPSPEEHHRSGESTDMSDGGSSDVMEDVDVIESDLKIRHRPAAAAAPSHSPLNIQTPENKTTTSDDTEEATAVWDSYKPEETLPEEANQGVLSDTSTMAEAVMEDAADFQPGATDDTVHDEIEEVQDNDSCLKESESVNEENHEEGEKVLKAECQEDEDVTTDEDISDKKTRQEEENVQWSLNKQTPPIGEKGDDNKTTLEINSEEPAIHIEDVPATCIYYGKDEKLDEENPDSIEYSSYSGNNQLSPEEEKKDNDESVEEEGVDYHVVAQQAEVWSTSLPSKMVMAPIRDGDCDEDEGLPGEVIEEVTEEEHLNKLTAVRFDTHSPQFDEQKEENGPTCDRKGSADHVEEEMLTCDVIVVSSEEHDSSTVSAPIKVDINDQSSIDTDAKAEIPVTAEFCDLSLACQLQTEDKMAPSLDEDPDSTIHSPEIPSPETENLPENHRNGSATAERYDDPHVQSYYKDQQSVHVIDNVVSDKASVAADPDTVQNVSASVIAEEISCPHMILENDEMRVNYATDAACLTALLMSEEISHPDMFSSSQDQEGHHVEKDFSEAGAAPVTTKDVSPSLYQIYLPSFEQSERRDDDISSPGIGKESGISSLAVSPDAQDAGKDFGVTVGDTVLPVMDCDLQTEGQTETQTSFFADDVALSVVNEDTAGTVFESYPSCRSQALPDWTLYESFAANEDMFGHEIEDGYHRAMDQIAAQIAVSFTSYTDDMKTQTDIKAVIEVVEIKEKAGVSIEMKEDTKEEKEEEEEDYERTEISIMEATMDNNEWITESNYQVFPWLNLSAQDHTKTNQLPIEECSAVTDATCTNIPPSTEVKQTSSSSLADENTENSKKVVAIQPMPQNVNVTFRVHYFTQSPYQTVAVTGNQQELGNWKGFIPLEMAKDGHWATVVSLPAESHVEWKFVVLDKGEVCRWEECGNRLLDTGYGDDLLVQKWWGLI